MKKPSGDEIGEVSRSQLEFLASQLEEEYEGDRDYYITSATVDLLEANGADERLLEALREAAKPTGVVEIRWEERQG